VWLRVVSLFTICNNIQFATAVGEKYTTAAFKISYSILMNNRTPTKAKKPHRCGFVVFIFIVVVTPWHKHCQHLFTRPTHLRQTAISLINV
jgi:hypothetical protein